jgi:hypothetical protein
MSCTQGTKYVVAEHGRQYGLYVRSLATNDCLGVNIAVDGTCVQDLSSCVSDN